MRRQARHVDEGTPPGDEPGLLPHQLVAAAVLKQAVADCRSELAAHRAQARAFLFGDRAVHWCRVAGLPVDALRRRVDQTDRRRRAAG